MATEDWNSDAHRIAALTRAVAAPRRMVLDTDTYNEIDDQYALTQVLLAPEAVTVEAVYAAPFHNSRSTGPGDGMEHSYQEILRVLDRLDGPRPPVLRGAQAWFADSAEINPAAADLIERARDTSAGPLLVVAIGAITNVAVALRAAPDIAGTIAVVWLGGHDGNRGSVEFNLRGDIPAAQVVFDSGVPLVVVPCLGVADHLTTTRAEIDRYVRACGPVGAFLAERYDEYVDDVPGRSKVIWDIAATSWAINPAWVQTKLVPAPVLAGDGLQASDPTRHLIAWAYHLDRDAIFGDVFSRLAAHASHP